MIKVENVEVFNFDGAIRGMRNPMNSWAKSDSKPCKEASDCPENCPWDYGYAYNPGCLQNAYLIGKNDMALMQKLYKAGSEHAKYLRQIMVSMDIVAPLFFWRQLDTYKVGVTRNSCSTMHKIMAKEFTTDDFSMEYVNKFVVDDVLADLNEIRDVYINFDDYKEDYSNKKEVWYSLVQLLPSGYNQRATITMNYANVMNMINQRRNHKLDEWHDFCDVLLNLPYVKEIRNEEANNPYATTGWLK